MLETLPLPAFVTVSILVGHEKFMKRLGNGPAEDMLNTVVDKGVSFPGKVAEAVRSRNSFGCEPESTSSVTLSQRSSARSGPPVMPSPKVLQYMSNPSIIIRKRSR